MALAAPVGAAAAIAPQNQMQGSQMQGSPPPLISNPMQVPDMPGSNVPVPPLCYYQPMEPPVAQPPGVPPPPPPQQMLKPRPCNMSGGGQSPTQ
ncbi:hypothetical protein LP420_18405 [Massilia sp. B-10]|nr:hypothetical protein LP420_18405 [Massilia sp. B-10]